MDAGPDYDHSVLGLVQGASHLYGLFEYSSVECSYARSFRRLVSFLPRALGYRRPCLGSELASSKAGIHTSLPTNPDCFSSIILLVSCAFKKMSATIL